MAGGREGLVDGDLDGSQFGVGHADEVQELEGVVNESYVEVCSCVSRACCAVLLSEFREVYPCPFASLSLVLLLLRSSLPLTRGMGLVLWKPLRV